MRGANRIAREETGNDAVPVGHRTLHRAIQVFGPPMQVSPSLLLAQDVSPDRADKILADCLPGVQSRSSVARLIRMGRVLVNGEPIRPSTLLRPGDRVEILEEPVSQGTAVAPEIPPFHVLFEDEDIIVVDKPAGLVVHPGSGRPAGTLMDALVRTRPEMIGVGEPGRWGIVHRLDRDTSGVMVLAKTALAHAKLSALFKEHAIHRIYLAIVRGAPGKDEGIIDLPLGRHVRDRKRISIATVKPRRAVTRWKVRKRYGDLTLLEVAPETGRTHQIRVHLSAAGLPVVGDPTYGRKRRRGAGVGSLGGSIPATMKRQALHAAVLGFAHPRDSRYVEFSAPLPPDMALLVSLCEQRGNASPTL